MFKWLATVAKALICRRVMSEILQLEIDLPLILLRQVGKKKQSLIPNSIYHAIPKKALDEQSTVRI